MDTSVETRHGIVRTILVNHLISSTFWFLFILFAFKWAYESDVGIVILFTCSSAFYYSTIFSYCNSQPKLDMILRKKYDYKMPFKTASFASLIIFLLSGVQYIFKFISPVLSDLYGIFAKFFNYHFFYFIYGRNGDCFNLTALVIILIIPYVISYLGYYLGVKKFSFADIYRKIVYKQKSGEEE